jgi:hypothetical protein
MPASDGPGARTPEVRCSPTDLPAAGVKPRGGRRPLLLDDPDLDDVLRGVGKDRPEAFVAHDGAARRRAVEPLVTGSEIHDLRPGTSQDAAFDAVPVLRQVVVPDEAVGGEHVRCRSRSAPRSVRGAAPSGPPDRRNVATPCAHIRGAYRPSPPSAQSSVADPDIRALLSRPLESLAADTGGPARVECQPAHRGPRLGASGVLAAAGVATSHSCPRTSHTARLDAPEPPAAATSSQPMPSAATANLPRDDGQMAASDPVRIQMPALGVSSAFMELGLQAGGGPARSARGGCATTTAAGQQTSSSRSSTSGDAAGTSRRCRRGECGGQATGLSRRLRPRDSMGGPS